MVLNNRYNKIAIIIYIIFCSDSISTMLTSQICDMWDMRYSHS